MWIQKGRDIKQLRTFRCLEFKHVTDEKGTRVQDKSEECLMIGYTPCGYRLFRIKENKIVLARDVIFSLKVLNKSWKIKNEENILK